MLLCFAAISRDLPPYTGPREGPLIPFAWSFVTDYLLATHAGWIFDLYFFAGIFAGMSYSNTYAMVQNLNLLKVRGTISALNLSTDLVGKGIGPLVGGILTAAIGIKQGLLVGVLFWIGCLVLWPPLYKTKPANEDRTREILSRRAGAYRERLGTPNQPSNIDTYSRVASR